MDESVYKLSVNVTMMRKKEAIGGGVPGPPFQGQVPISEAPSNTTQVP